MDYWFLAKKLYLVFPFLGKLHNICYHTLGVDTESPETSDGSLKAVGVKISDMKGFMKEITD